jgi:hypothetical protein
MGTELCTIAAMNTNHRLIDLFIPENCANQTGIPAVTTADARSGIKSHSTTFSQFQCTCRAYLSTWRVIASPAYYHRESPFHAPYRPYTYAGASQSSLVLSSGTGKHAQLAANTSLRVYDRQFHNLPYLAHLTVHKRQQQRTANSYILPCHLVFLSFVSGLASYQMMYTSYHPDTLVKSLWLSLR